jgi:hypothetical protein
MGSGDLDLQGSSVTVKAGRRHGHGHQPKPKASAQHGNLKPQPKSTTTASATPPPCHNSFCSIQLRDVSLHSSEHPQSRTPIADAPATVCLNLASHPASLLPSVESPSSALSQQLRLLCSPCSLDPPARPANADLQCRSHDRLQLHPSPTPSRRAASGPRSRIRCPARRPARSFSSQFPTPATPISLQQTIPGMGCHLVP